MRDARGSTWDSMRPGHIARIVIDPRGRQQRLRLRDRSGVSSAERARRLPHDRWRHDVEAGARGQRRTPAARISRWIRMIRRRCSRACGSSIIHRYDLHSGGAGSGVYVTHDGGATGASIAGHGLPAGGSRARQDRRRDRAEQSESRLRARAGRAGAGTVSLERSRRDLAAGESIAPAGRALAVLHAHGRVARR